MALNLVVAKAAAARVRLNEDALRKALGSVPVLGEPRAFDGEQDELCVRLTVREHAVYVAAPRALAQAMSQTVLGIAGGERGVLLYVIACAIARADLEARVEGFADAAAGAIAFPVCLCGGELRVIVPAALLPAVDLLV